MSYYPNIPLAGDIPAQSQGLMLANFTALGALINGVNNFVLLPEQAAAPVTAANQMALYTKDVGGVTAMFVRPEGAGTEINFTTCGSATPGWCVLPCGIKMAWGTIPITNGGIYNFPAGVAFANVFSVQVTPISNGVTKDMVSVYDILPNPNPTGFKATSYNANSHFDNINAYYFAVGN